MGEPADKPFEGIAPVLDPFWTLPNLISLARILLVVPAVWLVWLGAVTLWWALACVLLMAATDFLDGHLARKRDEATRWGRILDPLADKIAIGTIAIALVVSRGLSPWLAGAIVGRDLVILLAGIIAIKRISVVPVSNFWGKLTTMVMCLLGIIFVSDLEVLKIPVTVTAAVAIAVSSLSYVIGILRGRCWE